MKRWRESIPDDYKSNETSDTDYTDVYKESVNITHIIRFTVKFCCETIHMWQNNKKIERFLI